MLKNVFLLYCVKLRCLRMSVVCVCLSAVVGCVLATSAINVHCVAEKHTFFTRVWLP